LDRKFKSYGAHGNCWLCNNIWNSGKAWLHVFVSDDDSSSHAALKHSYKDKICLNEPVDSKKKVLLSYLLGYWSQFFFWLALHINKEFMEVIYTNWSIYAINSKNQMQRLWFTILDLHWNKIEASHMIYFELQWQLHLNTNSMSIILWFMVQVCQTSSRSMARSQCLNWL